MTKDAIDGMALRLRIDRNIGVPAYMQVAEQLKSEIVLGRLNVGGRVPPESELMEGSDLSRVTIRKALQMLENEGLVERKQGLGTFVREPINQELSEVQTITEVLLARGITPSVKVVSFGVLLPPEHVRRALGLNETTSLILAKRLYLDGNEPLALLHIYLPLSIRKHAEALRKPQLWKETTYTIWEKRAGVPIRGAAHSIRAGHADKEDAAALQIRRDDPVLILDRVTYAKDGRPLEFVSYHYHWRRFEFSVSAPRISASTP
jgi:GntR family transcriptional regulator